MKDLASRFSEVERRVRALVAENRQLRAQLRELERAKDAVSGQAKEADALRVRTVQVRERLQRLLEKLETFEGEEVAGKEAQGPAGKEG